MTGGLRPAGDYYDIAVDGIAVDRNRGS